MSYTFIDIETIPSLDECDNPINLGSAIIEPQTRIALLRPDAVIDQLTLEMPHGEDGQTITLLSLDSVWSITLVSAHKSGVTFWIPTEGFALMPGQAVKLLFVAPQKRWYLFDA
jgi:hypothetical protein